MGQNNSLSLEYDESNEMEEIRLKLEEEGPAAVYKYLQEKNDEWKSAEVLFGVTGRSATGKSTFINAIRNIKAGMKGFAECGSGDTTTEPTRYPIPENEKIVYVDLPGAATLKFKKDVYYKEMKMHEYDFFFIFFDKIISEDDLWLAKTIAEAGKPFCFVRSKIDVDLENAKADGKDAANIIPAIKKQIEDRIASHIDLQKNKAVFLISSRNKAIGQWTDLLFYVNNNIPSVKRDAALCFLPTITNRVLDAKYEMLRARIKRNVVLAVLTGAFPIPLLDVALNTVALAGEVIHYMTVFGLTLEQINQLDGIDQSKLRCQDLLRVCRLIASKPVDLIALAQTDEMKELIRSKLAGYSIVLIASSSTKCIPFIGSIVGGTSSGIIASNFLHGELLNLKQDALDIYEHLAKQTI